MTKIKGRVMNRKLTGKAKGEPVSGRPDIPVSGPETNNGNRVVAKIVKMIIMLNIIIRYLNFNTNAPNEVSRQLNRNNKIKIL